MYPEYLEYAKKEKNGRAEWSFNVANEVEEIHAGLFKKALKALKDGVDVEQVDFFVCQVCGNTVENNVPDKCPICGVPGDRFIKVQ